MNLDLDKLEQLAAVATPGPWSTNECRVEQEDGAIVAGAFAGSLSDNVNHGDELANAAFIAAANPAVVRELIARLRDQAKDIAHYEQQHQVLTAQAEALHQVGHALGLQAGDDLTEKAVPAARDLVPDAARWRAFLGSARIRPIGSAGLERPEPDNYAHMGLEIWTVFGRDYSQDLLDNLDADNAKGRRWLTQYADVARAAQGMSIAAKDARIAELEADRRVLQQRGEHPAPCARFCESNAYEIELRRLRNRNAELERLLATERQRTVDVGVIALDAEPFRRRIAELEHGNVAAMQETALRLIGEINKQDESEEFLNGAAYGVAKLQAALLPDAPAVPLDADGLPLPITREEVVEAAAHAIGLAAGGGFVLTVFQRPLQPLAMGNYSTQIEVRPARVRS